MELPKISIGTHPETGQGSGILDEVSLEVEIEGSSHFSRSALHGGLSQ